MSVKFGLIEYGKIFQRHIDVINALENAQLVAAADINMKLAEKKTQEILSLPSFPELTEQEVTFICNNIKGFLEK